jgi:hypothetical protein
MNEKFHNSISLPIFLVVSFLFEKRITIKIYDAIKAEKSYLLDLFQFFFEKAFAQRPFFAVQVLHDTTAIQHFSIASVKNALIGSRLFCVGRLSNAKVSHIQWSEN